MAYISDKDFYLEVAKGNVPGHLDYSAYGINTDIDTGTTPEDILYLGGTFVPPTTFRIHNIRSSSANDDGSPAGTGARTVRVYGVVSTGLADETVVMDGVTGTNTVNSYSDIYHMEVVTVGSNGSNVGNISAVAATDATTTAYIPAGQQGSKKCIRLIPPGYRGYLYDFQAGIFQTTASSFADVYLMIKKSSEVFVPVRYHSLSNSGNTVEVDEFKVPIMLDEDTWVKITCTGVTNDNTTIHGALNLILVQN